MNKDEAKRALEKISMALASVGCCRVTDVSEADVPMPEGLYWVIDHAEELRLVDELARFIESNTALCTEQDTHPLSATS